MFTLILLCAYTDPVEAKFEQDRIEANLARFEQERIEQNLVKFQNMKIELAKIEQEKQAKIEQEKQRMHQTYQMYYIPQHQMINYAQSKT